MIVFRAISHLPSFLSWPTIPECAGNLTWQKRYIERLPSTQPGAVGHVAYANSITLTPGTISLDVLEKQIEVHALTAESAADLESGEMGKRVEHLETG